MLHSVKNDFQRWSHYYVLPILIGNAAIYGNIVFILRTLRLARERLPEVIPLLHSEAAREESRGLLAIRIFSPKRLVVCSSTVTGLGLLTFLLLGINLPHITTTILFAAVIALIFWLLGSTIGLALGFWSWMLDFGRQKPRVDVFHPDRMGGLLPIADVSDWVISMGSGLAAIYSLGAYFSPYSHAEWKAYSYLWILLATILLVLAFILPATSVHSCLVGARNVVSGRISRQNERMFNVFDRGQTTETSEIMALMWFSESLGKLNVWPYRQLPARFASTILLQFVPPILDFYYHLHH